MKKIVLICILWILVMSVQVTAQARPIMGYDLVTWGTSSAKVREAYNIPASVPLVVEKTDSNVKSLTQNNVSDSIKERLFLFNNDRLYRVWVSYKDINDSNHNNLKSALTNRFGIETDFDASSESQILNNIPVIQDYKKTTYGRYSPELVVELIYIIYFFNFQKDFMNLNGNNSLAVCYTWKKFRDEYQASRLGL